MHCFCESGETFHLKIEGDMSADPIWCKQCGCNFEVEDVPISRDLQNELVKWARQCGAWIDWDADRLCAHGVELENAHNELGRALSEKVKAELGGKYKVSFSPSSSARRYARSDG